MGSRFKLLLFFITLATVSGLSSAITVSTRFAVDTLLVESEWPLLNPDTWPVRRLEAIRNPDYGVGVISAYMDNGTLKVMRISKSSVEIINSRSGYDPVSGVGDIRFDTSDSLDNDLFVTVWTDTEEGQDDWRYSFSTYLMQVFSDSSFIEEVGYYQGDTDNRLLFMMDFTADANDYGGGLYFADYAYAGGTSLYYLNSSDVIDSNEDDVDNLTFNVLPTDPNRTDLDTMGMEFDRTGNYNSYLTIADSESQMDGISAIYQLDPNSTWSIIAGPNDVSDRYYLDMCYDAKDGCFGGALYVTESITQTIMKVDPDGVHTVFASGFTDIQSITIDESGRYMYVSDAEAIYRIRTPGPTIDMQEPKTINDGIFTDSSGVPSLRLLWSEPVTFEAGDVYVEDERNQAVDVSLSGSGTEFMTITFARPLQYDKFTITIADTVVCTKSGFKIDGDQDGLAGGNAVIDMEHRLREDSDNNNYIDMSDLANLAEKWLWPN